ncbi:MAG: DUF1552 domain-containing protein [Proteobacteria bacterium]|nr:MAG: DUF1552 domain-containing protein [Pseudomonadota bacterium]
MSKKLPIQADINGRRMFLKGAAATMAIPFLPSLLPSKAEAASTPLPKIVLTGSTHGRWHGSWYPGAVPLSQVAPGVRAAKLSSIAGPMGRVMNTHFDGIRDKVNIIQGLDFLGISGHDQIIYTASNRIHYRDGEWANFTPTFPYTADVILAQSASFYGSRPPLDVLRLAPRKEGGYPFEGVAAVNGARTDGGGNFLPRYGDSLSRVYTYLNSFIDSAARSPNQTLARRFVIDKVLNQFKGVMGSSRISTDDKHSLQQYVDSLTDVQRDMRATGNQTLSCGRFAAQAETTDNDEFNQKLIDMMVIALSCGLTRVATYDLNWEACAQRYGGADFHGAQGVHGCDNGPNYENIANWTESFVKHYAYMVKKMDQAGLLESSLVLYANEMSSSVPNHHGVDIPVLTAGSLNGKFRTGEYISYYNMARQIGFSGGIQQNADLSRTNGYTFYPGRKWNEMMISMFSALGVPAGEYERDGKKGFGSYACNVPADKIGQCGNPQSDTALQAAMISYYAKEYKESVYATLPYLTG